MLCRVIVNIFKLFGRDLLLPDPLGRLSNELLEHGKACSLFGLLVGGSTGCS